MTTERREGGQHRHEINRTSGHEYGLLKLILPLHLHSVRPIHRYRPVHPVQTLLAYSPCVHPPRLSLYMDQTAVATQLGAFPSQRSCCNALQVWWWVTYRHGGG